MTAPLRVVLGQISGAHALRGEVRVYFFGDGPENLAGAPEVWLAESTDDPVPIRFDVHGCGSGRAGEVRLKLDGVDDRDAAEGLRGRFVLVDPATLGPLPEGEFYWHELVGCLVVDRGANEIGRVREIWETAAHDVLVVEASDGRRHLLSTARELMPEVDVEPGQARY